MIRRNAIGGVYSDRPLTVLGANIKDEMRRQKMTTDALAADSGLGRNTIARSFYEGDPSPTVATVEKIAKALDVPLWSLFVHPRLLPQLMKALKEAA